MPTNFTPAIRAYTTADVANLNELEDALAEVGLNPGETPDLLPLSGSDNAERRALASLFTIMGQAINNLEQRVDSLQRPPA